MSLRQSLKKGFIQLRFTSYFSPVKVPHRIHLVECPRDAIQGWPHPIATEDKLAYYRSLLRVGFDTLDLGSFVSPKAIPAMADTGKILKQLEEENIWEQVNTKALVIVANERGAREAIQYDSVQFLGFPLSMSQTFQERNTNANMEEAWRRLDVIANHCSVAGKELVVYLSMGFGNPYDDPWSKESPAEWIDVLKSRVSPNVISIADTVGAATPKLVEDVFCSATQAVAPEKLGAHLHLHPLEGLEKIIAAYNGGCRRFDGALRGVGGCPMAQDDLVGNAPSEWIVQWAEKAELWKVSSPRGLDQSLSMAADLFG